MCLSSGNKLGEMCSVEDDDTCRNSRFNIMKIRDF